MRRSYCQRHKCEEAEKTYFCFHGFAFTSGIQPPFAPFVHPKLPLAARLGLGWGARPSRLPFSASRQKPFPNPNGIESSSPRLRGRATLGNRPTSFSTRNGLHHPPSKQMKPHWGKNHFAITTRRSRSSPVRLGPSTPG